MRATHALQALGGVENYVDKKGAPKAAITKALKAKDPVENWQAHLSELENVEKAEEVRRRMEDWHKTWLQEGCSAALGSLEACQQRGKQWCEVSLQEKKAAMAEWSGGKHKGSWKAQLSENATWPNVLLASKTLLTNETASKLMTQYVKYTQDWLLRSCLREKKRPRDRQREEKHEHEQQEV